MGTLTAALIHLPEHLPWARLLPGTARAHHPTLSHTPVPPHPPVTRQPVQVRAGVGESRAGGGQGHPGQPQGQAGAPVLPRGDWGVGQSCSTGCVACMLTQTGHGPPALGSGPVGPLGVLLSEAAGSAGAGTPTLDPPSAPPPPSSDTAGLGRVGTEADVAPRPAPHSGHQHQVQPAAGGPDPHHGARGRHPDREEVVAPPPPPVGLTGA